MKIATFQWTVSVQVPDTFSEEDDAQMNEAYETAWMNVQKGDGELYAVQDEPPDGTPEGFAVPIRQGKISG